MPDNEPVDDQSEATFTNLDLTTEADTVSTPETVERASDTAAALGTLVESAAQYAHANTREIVQMTERFDTRPNIEGDRFYETTERVNKEDDKLSVIELRTFVDDSDAAYKMSVSYDPKTPGPVMLSLETPLDQASPWGTDFRATVRGGEAGFAIEHRRIQDYLYMPDADQVPVREGDFSYLYDYRRLSPGRNREATSAELDVLLGLVAESVVMDGKKRGPKTTDLVPAFAELIKND